MFDSLLANITMVTSQMSELWPPLGQFEFFGFFLIAMSGMVSASIIENEDQGLWVGLIIFLSGFFFTCSNLYRFELWYGVGGYIAASFFTGILIRAIGEAIAKKHDTSKKRAPDKKRSAE